MLYIIAYMCAYVCMYAYVRVYICLVMSGMYIKYQVCMY